MKKLFAIGLILLFVSQVLFSVHSDQVNLLEPFDIIHWIIFFGLIFILPYSLIFSKGIYQKIGGSITLIGIICSVGMCVIDFILWTYRNNIAERNDLVNHLVAEQFIWSVFITIGPAFFFIGYAIQALDFTKEHPIGSISTLLGATIVGLGHFIFPDYRIIYLIGYLSFISGLLIISLDRFRSPHHPIQNVD